MQDLISKPNPIMHVFVCINDRTKTRPGMASCAPEITADTVRQVKAWILQNGLMHDVLITKTGCLGICPKSGAVAVIYPKGRWVTNINSAEDIIKIIKEELNQ